MTPPLMRKYPRTQHIEGSRLGPGDEDLSAVPFRDIAKRPLVVEEKMDGANCAISFDASGQLWLQSRGHFLTGGAREKHFNPLKPWAHANAEALRERLGDRYVMYGEWLYAKHTVSYDALPNHFLEFDILDQETGEFLSTPRRRALLEGTAVSSVPVLASQAFDTLASLVALVGPSTFKTSAWRERLAVTAAQRGLDPERILHETDPSSDMEGLYLKVETEAVVVARYKWVRHTFLTSVVDSGSHWLSRPIVPNGLK